MHRRPRLDPRIFISPPYVACPKCGAQSFGVLIIAEDRYFRRCKECLYPPGTGPHLPNLLPKLSKRIVYLDQMAVSNVAKAATPGVSGKRRHTANSFWNRLYNQIDRLVKMQLVACPSSLFHTSESLLSSFYEPLKVMYEYLSAGVAFYDHETIKRFQISQDIENWVRDPRTETKIEARISTVTNGKIDAWQERLFVSANLIYGTDWVDELREIRRKGQSGMRQLFEFWKSKPKWKFDDWVRWEVAHFVPTILSEAEKYRRGMQDVFAGQGQLNVESLLPPPAYVLLYSIRDTLTRCGVSEPEIPQMTVEYLGSPRIRNIPFIKILSMLFAAMARKANSGQLRPPNRGMIADLEIISVFLPYCDLMFVDNECRGLLLENPLRDLLTEFETEVYSAKVGDKFLERLGDIESGAAPDHLAALDEVYGDAWRQPFRSVPRE